MSSFHGQAMPLSGSRRKTRDLRLETDARSTKPLAVEPPREFPYPTEVSDHLTEDKVVPRCTTVELDYHDTLATSVSTLDFNSSGSNSPTYTYQDQADLPPWHSPQPPTAPHIGPGSHQHFNPRSNTFDRGYPTTGKKKPMDTPPVPEGLRRIKAESPRPHGSSQLPFRNQRHHPRSSGIQDNSVISKSQQLRRVRSSVEGRESADFTKMTVDKIDPDTDEPDLDSGFTMSELRKSRQSWHPSSTVDPLFVPDLPPVLPQVERLETSLGDNIDQLTDDISKMILNHGFGLDLRELSSPMDAWLSVKRCLQEVSQIVGTLATPRRTSPYQAPFHQRPASGSSRNENGQGSAGGARGAESKKRRSGEDPAGRKDGAADDEPEGNDEQDDEGDGRKRQDKRTRIDPKDQIDENLSCPYRKRNIKRFNIRDHYNCAHQSHKDFSSLKRHIKSFHHRGDQSYPCHRCYRGFASEEDLSGHVRVPDSQRCSIVDEPPESNDDPEDGITSAVQRNMNERKFESKINTWRNLWLLLFPGDEDIKSSDFVAPIAADFQEIESVLELGMTDIDTNIKVEVDRLMHTLDWNHALPLISALISQQVASVVRVGLAECLADCKHTIIGNSSGMPRRRKQAAPTAQANARPQEPEIQRLQPGLPAGPQHPLPGQPNPRQPVKPIAPTQANFQTPFNPHQYSNSGVTSTGPGAMGYNSQQPRYPDPRLRQQSTTSYPAVTAYSNSSYAENYPEIFGLPPDENGNYRDSAISIPSIYDAQPVPFNNAGDIEEFYRQGEQVQREIAQSQSAGALEAQRVYMGSQNDMSNIRPTAHTLGHRVEADARAIGSAPYYQQPRSRQLGEGRPRQQRPLPPNMQPSYSPGGS